MIQTLVYYYQDSLGSTTQIADVAGKLLETYTYDLYGQPTILSRVGSIISASLVGVHDLFAGARWMDELGLALAAAQRRLHLFEPPDALTVQGEDASPKHF